MNMLLFDACKRYIPFACQRCENYKLTCRLLLSPGSRSVSRVAYPLIIQLESVCLLSPPTIDESLSMFVRRNGSIVRNAARYTVAQATPYTSNENVSMLVEILHPSNSYERRGTRLREIEQKPRHWLPC